MLPNRIICYLSTMNLLIAMLGYIKTENYWYVPPLFVCVLVCIVCSTIEYRRNKNIKEAEIKIATNREKDHHYCNVLSSNVVCFEWDGELWVNEYISFKGAEGRTYMVYHCPWCGYQTEKSKIHEKFNMNYKVKESD